ncbi:MAG: hypothetical protein M0Z46_17085 [Actinomycetota bacterium]|nr:hypothetical protein [Actinomycetota bacterium]
MTTIPAKPTTVWQLAAETGVSLEVVIYQAVAYGAWLPGGEISAEWGDSLASILHSSTPWRRQGAPAGAGPDGASESVTAFAARVLAHLGQVVNVGNTDVADGAVGAGLGERDGEQFTGYPDEASVWAQLANGEITLAELSAETS